MKLRRWLANPIVTAALIEFVAIAAFVVLIVARK